ncbi:MAG: hypothetical protein HOO67_03955 [Candidatus Peribacteraceae bacterium]|nr:hypothetical protein [Candidatus Peribacteraceae bacterium]
MQSKTVKTREFLRNFKTIKGQLTSGRIHYVVIDIGENRELKLSVRRPPSNGKDLARLFSSLPKPIRIRRTHLFDELFQ